MKIDLSNPKHRQAFIILTLVIYAAVFTIIGYYSASRLCEDNGDTTTETATPTATVTTTVSTTPNDTDDTQKLRDRITNLNNDLEDANEEVDGLTVGKATAVAYVDFLEYLTQVINAHDGFTGWTDAEYQIASEKARATGNDDFISSVDSAWNDTSIDVTTRVVRVYQGIVSGINYGLDQ